MTDGPVALLADDDASIRLVTSRALIGAGFQVKATASPETLTRWVADGEGDVIVSDVYMGDANVFELLPGIMRSRPELPVIVMSGQNTVLTAASSAEHGVFGYLPKPFDLDELIRLAGRAVARRPRVSAAPKPSNAVLVGRSAAMQPVFKAVAHAAQTRLPALITGEPGAGRQTVARAIHHLASGPPGPFCVLDLDGVPIDPPDAGSTLFVPAVERLTTKGVDALARHVDGAEHRLLAASGPGEADALPLELLHSVSVFRIAVPPLREREGDLEELATAILAEAESKGLRRCTVSKAAFAVLASHSWPGNVRELRSMLLRLAATTADGNITESDVEADLLRAASRDGPNTDLHLDLAALIDRHAYGAMLEQKRTAKGRSSDLHASLMAAMEASILEKALALTGGNKLKAAQVLGMNRNTLRARLTQLGLDGAGDGDGETEGAA